MNAPVFNHRDEPYGENLQTLAFLGGLEGGLVSEFSPASSQFCISRFAELVSLQEDGMNVLNHVEAWLWLLPLASICSYLTQRCRNLFLLQVEEPVYVSGVGGAVCLLRL